MVPFFADLPDILKRTCKDAILTSSAAQPCSPSVVPNNNSEKTQKHDYEIICPQSPSLIQPCNSSIKPWKLQTGALPHSPLLAQLPVSAPSWPDWNWWPWRQWCWRTPDSNQQSTCLPSPSFGKSTISTLCSCMCCIIILLCNSLKICLTLIGNCY